MANIEYDEGQFQNNLKKLQDGDALPDHEHKLPDHIKKAIADLGDGEVETLIKLAKQTDSHLFLHDKDNHVVAMGL